VYRYGQEKNVFVYRLLSAGSMEEKIYKKQVTKRGEGISCCNDDRTLDV
jgi:SNF2 family DNA or RNA helicase